MGHTHDIHNSRLSGEACVHFPGGLPFLMGTTQACTMEGIMCSCLTAVVVHMYKEYYSASSSTAHAPKQFGPFEEEKNNFFHLAVKTLRVIMDIDTKVTSCSFGVAWP